MSDEGTYVDGSLFHDSKIVRVFFLGEKVASYVNGDKIYDSTMEAIAGVEVFARSPFGQFIANERFRSSEPFLAEARRVGDKFGCEPNSAAVRAIQGALLDAWRSALTRAMNECVLEKQYQRAIDQKNLRAVGADLCEDRIRRILDEIRYYDHQSACDEFISHIMSATHEEMTRGAKPNQCIECDQPSVSPSVFCADHEIEKLPVVE